MSENKYLTEVQAAELAGVVHETVNNWGMSGRIQVIRDREILDKFNANKQGRPSSRLYLRDDILRMMGQRGADTKPSDIDEWWTVAEMADETKKSVRTVYRAVKSRNPRTWRDHTGKIYVHPMDGVALMDELDPISDSE